MIARSFSPYRDDLVVLVHGLAAHRLMMHLIAQSLQEAFTGVVNWGYPSLFSPIEQHGRALAEVLKRLDEDGGHKRIHLVGHSMGGIIGRLALTHYTPRYFGRFVMIAPPNRGSHVARHLAPYLGRICPPLVQLADEDESFVCSLPQPQVRELGIIAAKTDILVLEPSTRLGCECDHIVLPGRHSSLLWRRETAEQVRHFLENGRFKRLEASLRAAG